MPMHDLALVQHMVQALDRITELTRRIDEERFRSEWVFQNALLHEMQIFGQAAGNLSDELKAELPEIPWRKINGLRNRIVHEYFAIDLGVVWDTAAQDMPGIRPTIRKLLQSLE